MALESLFTLVIGRMVSEMDWERSTKDINRYIGEGGKRERGMEREKRWMKRGEW